MKTRHFILLLLAVAALFLTACAVNQADLAGRINGQPISRNAFNESHRRHYENFQVLQNRAPSREERELIKRETWLNLARVTILQQYFQKYNVKVSPAEVLEHLQNNIPGFIQNSPRFTVDGAFDPLLYNQSLLYDTPENLGYLRQEYLEMRLPILKLQDELIKNELLTAAERKLIRSIIQSRADVEFTVLPLELIQPRITDEEVGTHYQRHLSEYRLDPFINLSFASIDVLPTRTDIAQTRDYADSLYLDLSVGKPLEGLLQEDNPFAAHVLVQNSGFVKNGDLDSELYALLSNLEEGSWSKPQETQDGYSLIQLEKRTKSMSSFTRLFVPFIPAQSSIDRTRPQAEIAVRLAREQGMAVACEELSLIREKTQRITPEQLWHPDPLIVQAIQNDLPGKIPGHIFEPIYSAVTRKWVVVELIEATLNEFRSLTEVENEIRTRLMTEKREIMALQISEAVLNGYSPAPAGATQLSIKNFGADSRDFGKNTPRIAYSILKPHLKKQPPKAFIWEGKVWMPSVVSVSQNKSMAVDEEKIQAVFRENLDPDWFESWLNQKLEQAVINKYDY